MQQEPVDELLDGECHLALLAAAEFVNARLKERLGLRRFRVRGLAKVRAQAMWAALTYNVQQWTRPSPALGRPVHLRGSPLGRVRQWPGLLG